MRKKIRNNCLRFTGTVNGIFKNTNLSIKPLHGCCSFSAVLTIYAGRVPERRSAGKKGGLFLKTWYITSNSHSTAPCASPQPTTLVYKNHGTFLSFSSKIEILCWVITRKSQVQNKTPNLHIMQVMYKPWWEDGGENPNKPLTQMYNNEVSAKLCLLPHFKPSLKFLLKNDLFTYFFKKMAFYQMVN